MRYHHDGLVQEMTLIDDPAAFTNVKKTRLFAYIAFWFTALAGVIERYEQLRDKSAIPASPEIDLLITDSFKDVIKPFRNSVAHCSHHDDRRTLEIFNHEITVPDEAAAIAHAFHAYLDLHKSGKA